MKNKQHTWGTVVGTIALLAAPVGVVLIAPGLAGAAHTVSTVEPDNDKVCQPQSDHIQVNGNVTEVVYTAPAGMLVASYCVKAGSANQGDGPVYVTVSPPAASVTIRHPSGKELSHYTVTLVAAPTTSTPSTTSTSPTTLSTPTTSTPPVTTPQSTAAAEEQEQAVEQDVEVKGEQATQPQVKGKGQAQETQAQETQVEVAGRQAEVPTVITAGVSGDSGVAETPVWALALGAAGAALLVIAVVLARVARVRRGGAHAAR